MSISVLPLASRVATALANLDLASTSSAGGYVVVPPSIHISGQTYEWSVDHHPDEVPLAVFPDSLLHSHVALKHAAPASRSRELVADCVTEGTRNSALTALAGH